MGMYTGLRCKIKVKKEFDLDMSTLMKSREWNNSAHSVLQEFAGISRSSSIPFGSCQYTPREWSKTLISCNLNQPQVEVVTNGFENVYNNQTKMWSFQCSLKNYDETIEYFIDNVLQEIAEDIIHLESIHEESSVSTLYTMENNKIIKLNYGIIYSRGFYEYESMYDEDKNIRYYDYDFGGRHVLNLGKNGD